VELYLSEDAVITPSGPLPGDYPLGMQPTGWLEPGQCTSLQLQANAWGPEGTLYLGAYVDPYQSRAELREDNNTYVGGLIGVGNGPDFVVTAVSGPTLVQMGASFSASVTVCNQGTMGDSTDVELYLSEDDVITPNGPPPGDSFVGGVSTGYLQPGQCTSLPVSGSAWVPQDGVYYLGAYVDPFESRAELIESNNVLVGQLVFVQP